MITYFKRAASKRAEQKAEQKEIKKTMAAMGIKKATWAQDFKKFKYIYLMLLPVVIYYFVFEYIPMGGLIIAFQDFKPIKGYFDSAFVGFKHFESFLTGFYAFRTIRNTLLLSVYQIVLGFPAPVILALLLNEVKHKKFKAINQTISYLPHFISAVVVTGLVIDFVKSDGLVSIIIAFFTGQEATNLLAEAGNFRFLYTSMGIWQSVGWGTIIYLATLANADPSLYEAATLDGAGRFKQIWHITIPVLIPVFTIQLIMRMGSIMSEGPQTILLLQNDLNMETSDIISTYVYRRGIQNMEYSFATAVGLFNSVVNLVLLCFANWFSRKFVNESLW